MQPNMPGEQIRRIMKDIDVKNKELPYEKFESLGPDALSDTELLAIIIRSGTVGFDSVSIARQVLALSKEKDTILGLQNITLPELERIKGIGKVKAIRIMCVVELTRRMTMQSRKESLCLSKPSTVADYYMEQFRHLETEQVLLILTDNKNNRITDIIISKGTVNTSLISPREIFLEALRYHAVHVLLLHNHPSGDPTPSNQDIQITKMIKEASKILNIPLVDHIIIGDNKYISLKEHGLL